MLTGSGEHQHIRDVDLAVDRSLPTAELTYTYPRLLGRTGLERGSALHQGPVITLG
jgi:hypothetical protein